jgi:hypothetical protein
MLIILGWVKAVKRPGTTLGNQRNRVIITLSNIIETNPEIFA